MLEINSLFSCRTDGDRTYAKSFISLIIFITGLAICRDGLSQDERPLAVKISRGFFLENFEKNMGFSYSQPSGYHAIDSTLSLLYSCTPQKPIGSIFFAIKSDSSNILIVFRFMQYTEETEKKAARLIRRKTPEWTANEDYLHYSKVYADTINSSIVSLEKDFLKSNFNAAKGAMFISSCTYKLLGLPFDKYLVIGNGRKFISITFHFDNSAQGMIDEEIKRIAKSKIIYFNENEEG